MTCRECELALGAGENTAEHLAACESCRALAEEMRANALAFESFADDPLPPVRYRVMAAIRTQSRARRVARWSWALAAAAMIAVLICAWPRQRLSHPMAEQGGRTPGSARDPLIAPTRNVSTARSANRPRTRGAVPRKPAEVLKVKMFTDDPNVVIYWLVEKKEGAE